MHACTKPQAKNAAAHQLVHGVQPERQVGADLSLDGTFESMQAALV